LKYIEVDVDGLSDTVIALNDSGCQLCAVNRRQGHEIGS